MAAEQTVHAIVLRRRDAGESDRRLTLLTREVGVMDVVAKGARKSGSRLSGSSEPLSASILQIAPGKKQSFVTQAQPISSFPGLRSDYDRLSYALALAELAAGVIPHDHPADEEFGFMVRALHDLEIHEKPLVAFVWAQVRLMELAGFWPRFDRCALTDVAIQEAQPYVSPHAGGYIVADRAFAFNDSFQTKAEVLYGLTALSECEAPPLNLKEAAGSMRVLVPFWRAIIDRPIPAMDAVVTQI